MAGKRFLQALAFFGTFRLLSLALPAIWSVANGYLNPGGPVVVMRDEAQIRFANESVEAYSACDITIAGPYSARLLEMPPRAHTAVLRAEFDPNMSGDDFSRRAKSLTMTCQNSRHDTVVMKLK